MQDTSSVVRGFSSTLLHPGTQNSISTGTRRETQTCLSKLMEKDTLSKHLPFPRDDPQTIAFRPHMLKDKIERERWDPVTCWAGSWSDCGESARSSTVDPAILHFHWGEDSQGHAEGYPTGFSTTKAHDAGFMGMQNARVVKSVGLPPRFQRKAWGARQCAFERPFIKL